MTNIYTFILIGFVLLTSIWSLICLRRNATDANKQNAGNGVAVLGQSRIDVHGILTMTPPLEQLKAADF